ncbi:hypothetical protein [Streptomyces sp. NPDC013455]|uniref:hypothetical protein n=1 Tax=Streptomyces sp. NPDC013455 TaxID=3155605 RepID=UPI0033D2CB19
MTSSDRVIRENIAHSAGDRGFLSQNVLAQLRNLVEGLVVWAHRGDGAAEFHYHQVGPALDAVRGLARFRLLGRFHGLLQASVSHYTLDRDPSERLMLKYHEYLTSTSPTSTRPSWSWWATRSTCWARRCRSR